MNTELEYWDMPKSTINKVKTNLKKKIESVLKSRANNTSSDVHLANMDADMLYFVLLMEEFKIVTGETDLDVVNEWTIYFIDNENNKDVIDFIKKCLVKYNIEDNSLNGYKVKSSPKRKTGLRQLENSVRKMW